jgi:lipopolysaccharide/colanic/teichoic acid biosynthesis glycosyltransferase
VGQDRKPFYLLKFRSMRVNDSADTAWTRPGDPRRTRFGVFMRRWSIDELPQLFNVLRGEMSLVGPRPEIPRYVEHFKYSIPLYMVRHRVKPGLTGWAQVHGLRGDTSIPARVRYDLYYIENWSPLLDLKILLMTPFRGLANPQEEIRRKEERYGFHQN